MKIAAPYTTNRPYVGNIAIIGFAQNVPLKNKLIASFTAMIFTMKAIILLQAMCLVLLVMPLVRLRC